MASVLAVIVFLLFSAGLPGQTAAKPAGKDSPKEAAGQVAPQQGQPGSSNKQAAGEKSEDCGCETKLPADVVATINGKQITLNDIDGPIKARVEELKGEVVKARAQELDLQINSILLESEAKKRGVSATQLLEAEVAKKVPAPTDAEAQAFYDQNRAKISEPFAQIKADIIEYLRQQRQREQAKKFADTLRAGAKVSILAKDVTPPSAPADRARVFATVNDRKITSGDIEDSLRALIFAVQEQIYAMRKQSLDMQINDLLLTQEADKQKVTAKALLEREVTGKVRTVTDAEAQKFYDENKNRINGEFAQVKPQIIEYLNRREVDKAEGAYAERLRSTAKVAMNLPEPSPPVYNIAIDDQPVKGGEQAAVTIVEFTDFQCPTCASAHPILEEVVKTYGDRVKFVVRDFPLTQHENAFKAAEAAEAARQQGKYWEFIKVLFENQKDLGADKLKEYATRVGLDRKKFDEALDGGRYAEKVQRDVEDAFRMGVNSTPTVFVNGRKVKDGSLEGVKAAVDAALKQTSK